MDTASRRAQLLFRRYGNRDGRSGVVSYALAGAGIVVRFADGATYLYDRDCPGAAHVARMKALAQAGRGVATYISQRIGRRYRARLDAGAASLLPDRLHSTRQNTALR
jgi:hypothetical protein